MIEQVQQPLDAITAIKRDEGQSISPPAAPVAIAATHDYLLATFGVPLPQVMFDFWSQQDGLNFNGMYIYAATPGRGDTPHPIAGMQEMSDDFREMAGDRYILFGDTDMDALVHDRDDGGWHIVDKVGLTSFERFDSCDALIAATLGKYLEMWRNP